MSYFKFEIVHESKKSRARVGKIHTPHGIINTPNFVGVGTNGTIKAVDNTVINSMDLELMFCNTYHLIVDPGEDIVAQGGGLHSYINRNKPIITDSGGFQVFSLAYGTVKEELKSKGTKKYSESIIKISEKGVLFRSYKDGRPILLTPETSIQAQKKLGADIIIPFDELPPYHITKKKLEKSLQRTHRWEKRSLEEHLKNPNQQAIYGVIHGGIDLSLRKQSCKFLTSLPFDGYAIGGSLGKTRDEMVHMLTHIMPHIPTEKPNHLLGIGDLPSLEACVPLGLDTFDSSHPTRCARHGLLFTFTENIKIKKTKYKADFSPIDKNCPCLTCKNYSLSYIHHLFKANELTAYTLATIHNIQHMTDRMARYRELILEDRI